MKIDRKIILEEKDIFAAIKLYLQNVRSMDPKTICSFQLSPSHPDHDVSKDEIHVIIQQEVI